MTTLMYIAIILAVALAIVLILAALRPNTFRIERSININAPADKIFPLINDYKNWGSWSPYEHVDPAMQRTFSGAPAGKGSVYEWSGNKNIGHG
ncbi:MAG: SRPBCC family protein, partial [Afipia sp.]